MRGQVERFQAPVFRARRAAIMQQYTSSLLRLLDERGYIHQLTDAEGLDTLASKQIVPGYIGFDATAPSLHIGSLVQIMMLRRLQQTGHKPVVLMGGGTTRIGDPTGRDESRKMLSDQTIEDNIASIRQVFARLLTFGDGPTDAVMVNNHDWLGKLGYIELLQEVGTHFTVNRMLTFDSVKLRLDREQPMTFLEFNYMILQGYDFRHLVKPGITGWAQVNYPYGANMEDTLRKLEYDLYYIRHFSFVLDATIVLKTIHIMLFGKGR